MRMNRAAAVAAEDIDDLLVVRIQLVVACLAVIGRETQSFVPQASEEVGLAGESVLECFQVVDDVVVRLIRGLLTMSSRMWKTINRGACSSAQARFLG